MRDLTNLLSSKTMTLEKYLDIRFGVFEIPFSQRNYEWGKSQINRLWNDLVDLYNNSGQEEHLLNFFTLSKSNTDDDENNVYNIYDGQQRTISCLLILAVISQKLNTIDSKDAKETSDEIQTDYFTSKKSHLRKNVNKKSKIKFDNKTDSDFFYAITNPNIENNDSKIDISKLDNNGNKKSLLNNYNIIKEKLDNFISEHDDIMLEELLSELCDIMVNKCYLVVLIAYDEEVAARMFESLNNTGKNLEKYYVLKNDLVRCLGEDNVKDSWSEIEDNLINLNYNNFLRAFATINNGKTTQAKVLDKIYESFNINSKDESAKHNGEKLLNGLLKASHTYMTIFNTNKFTDSNKNELNKFRKLSDYLDKLSFKQHIPIILSMIMKNKDLSDINKVLRAVIVLSVRNFYINGEKSNTIEDSFANYAKDIYSDDLSVELLLKHIYKVVKNDESVRPNIISKEFSTNYKATRSIKALLTIIYNKSFNNSELEISIDKSELEHILPRNPSVGSQWIIDFPDDDNRNEYTYKLGNLTLWVNTKNSLDGNAEFKVKKEDYKDSPLIENQDIAKYKRWTAKEIDERTESLADTILKVFTIE